MGDSKKLTGKSKRVCEMRDLDGEFKVKRKSRVKDGYINRSGAGQGCSLLYRGKHCRD